MSIENLNPDVVVVGMPSCGKTVFFTVLGKKFTNLVDGKCAAPLGFRMGTCDRRTANVVNVAYDRLCQRDWPEATKEGQIMPLRWEVFTGRRRIFELFSMDIAGETFKKAFDINDDDNVRSDGGRMQAIPVTSLVEEDSGDELYRRESKLTDSSSVDVPRNDDDKAASMLKRAIETAKVVCFMVNIALPDKSRGLAADAISDKKRFRFRSSVMNMYLLLKDMPELRAKSMIVLTQAHRHQGEIERAGGPVMYLAYMCGGAASELSNLAKENDIPVIAVSAINELDGDDNKLPEIGSPDDISSSGLFGFLLTVSGMVARDDGLAVVKDAYLAYQRDRMEYLKGPSRTIRIRLPLARIRYESAAAFIQACNAYLDNSDNLCAHGAKAALSTAVRDNYKFFTKNDPDIVSATNKVYVVRDKLWDKSLRKAAVVRGQTTADDIYGEVKKGLERAFPEKRHGNALNEEFVYGFCEEDLAIGSEASTYRQWIELNLQEYGGAFRNVAADLGEVGKDVINKIKALETLVGKDEFRTYLTLVEKLRREFEEKLSRFRAEWLEDGVLVCRDVNCLAVDVADSCSRIQEYIAEHEKYVEERKKILQQQENERRQAEIAQIKKIAAVRQRRRIMIVVLLLLAIVVSALSGGHYYFGKKNQMVVETIKDAVARADYSRAKRLFDSMYTVNWLDIDRLDYLCRDFQERLTLAAKCDEFCQSVSARRLKLDEIRRWLHEVKIESAEISEARRLCDDAVADCSGLIPLPVTFAEIVRSDMDLHSRCLAVERCDANLKSSIEAIDKVRDDWEVRRRKEDLMLRLQESQRLMQKIDQEIGNMDMVSVTNGIEAVKQVICRLDGLSIKDETSAMAVQDCQKKADVMLGELEKRRCELRDAMLAKLLDAIQSAVASNSVSKEMDKLDMAFELSADERVSGGLQNLKERLESLTVKAYAHLLAEIRNDVEWMHKERTISGRLIDGMRRVLCNLEIVRDGLRGRIPEGSKAHDRIISCVDDLRRLLPIIIQVDGVGLEGDRTVGVRKMSEDSPFMNGTSPETFKQCVYLIVPRDELPPNGFKYVNVVDTDGKGYKLAIPRAKLASGINRFDVNARLINRKEIEK